MKLINLRSYSRRRAYTLIEALVASSVLLIGISAAGSLSLSMVTQEEISERSIKAFSYLENAAALYRMGVDPSMISNLLPPEPVITSFTHFPGSQIISGSDSNSGGLTPSIGNASTINFQIQWKPSAASQTSGISRWTGGDKDNTRSASIMVVKSSSFPTFPRATAFP